MKNVEIIFWVCFAIAVLVNIVTAYFFGEIAKEKGYDLAKYAVLCAFLGLAGWIMVVALPDRYKEEGPKPRKLNSTKKEKIERVQKELNEEENDDLLNDFISKLENK